MIHLDTYLENYETKLEEIQNSIVYVKSYKKPKIRITRLSEERKFVPVELDIEINENLVIKDRFDWNLNDENVCIEDFVNDLCDTLNLPEINRTRLKASLIYQLIDYIERNTYYPRQKNKDQKNDDEEFELDDDIKEVIANSSKISGNHDHKFSGQIREEEEQKKTARQRKLDEMRRTSSSQIQPMGKASYIRDKRSCKNCNYVNNAPNFECKKCKVAFYLLDMLDFSQWKVAQAVQYYEICVSYFPLLGDYVRDYTNFLSPPDFTSIYSLKCALIKLFPQMKELTEDNLKIVNNKLEDLFADFLVGIVVYRQGDVLPQKRRGRKPKSWYEDQEKRKKDKNERKQRGEVVSSDHFDEDESDDEDDIQTINKKISEIEQLANNAAQAGAQPVANTSNPKEPQTQEKDTNTKEDEQNNTGQMAEEGDQESNTEGSLVVRRGRGRPPKKASYLGKKRGRKPKTLSESLIRASSKNIGDQERDDENAQQLEDGENKNEMGSEGEENEEGQESRVKSSVMKNDEDNLGDDKMEEEQLFLVKNTSIDPLLAQTDSKKSREKYLEEEEEEQFEQDDEDDEDYGSVARKSAGKRGRPPKQKSSLPGRRGRKPLPKKDEKHADTEEMKPENLENQEEENVQIENKNEAIEEEEEQEKEEVPQPSLVKNQQKGNKKKQDEQDEEVPDDSHDEDFSIKKPPVRANRRGRPRKEEQQLQPQATVSKDEEEEDAAAIEDEDDSFNLANKKSKIIKKPLRIRFTRHQHHQTQRDNSSDEDNREAEEHENSKISTRKHSHLKKKEPELSEDDKALQSNESDEDFDDGRKKKRKEKNNIRKKDDTEEEENEPRKGGRQDKKKETEDLEDEDLSANDQIQKKNQDDNDNDDEGEGEQGEDMEEEAEEEEQELEGEEDEEENEDQPEEEEESHVSGVRTRRSQRNTSDLQSQKKKEVPKQKKIGKDKSHKSEQVNEAPRKKGRPPKKIIQRGRKK